MKQTFELNETQLRNIIKESIKKALNENIDELSNSTIRKAIYRMQDKGQDLRAQDLGDTSRTLYNSNGIKIIDDPYEVSVYIEDEEGTSSYDYNYSVGGWFNDEYPRFTDRRAAVILAKAIASEKTDSGKITKWGDKNLYIA